MWPPRVLSSPILVERREEEAAGETRLDEITVLVTSVEAINTHEVGLWYLSPWQPRLPSGMDSEGGAQEDGCWCTRVCMYVHVCAGVCTSGCCECSHQHIGEGGAQARMSGRTGGPSPAALAPVSLPEGDSFLPLSLSLPLSLPPFVFVPFCLPFSVSCHFLSWPSLSSFCSLSVCSCRFPSLFLFSLTLHSSQFQFKS